MSRRRLPPRTALRRGTDDPLALLVGLFDCALVLALGLMQPPAPEAPHGQPAPADYRTLPRYREVAGETTGEGRRLGVAYQLGNGEVVYVPEVK